MAGGAIAADRGTRAEARPRWFAWRWAQQWRETTFLHWRVKHTALRPCVHEDVDADVFDGSAWVSLVYFRLRTRPRGLPFAPGVSSLVELNLRTYVRRRDGPGIYFLSMHATNRLAISIAKLFTPLPYEHARMAYNRQPFGYECQCTSRMDPRRRLMAEIEPYGETSVAVPGSLDAWLIERYRLYIPERQNGDRRSRLLYADVRHPPWQSTPCSAQVAINTLGEPFGLDINRPPDAAHFSPGVEARFGRFLPVET